MRGKLQSQSQNIFHLRITPAGAGKTTFTATSYGIYKDHPRRCGENTQRTKSREYILGSPPQVRGKPVNALKAYQKRGITPAGAGKTDFKLKSNRKEVGSPPQVRGKRLTVECGEKTDRITPAGAGKTCICICFRRRQRDHPRRCGENVYILWNNGFRLGSPPQVRGKHDCPTCHNSGYRITPAGAGKTSLFSS